MGINVISVSMYPTCSYTKNGDILWWCIFWSGNISNFWSLKYTGDEKANDSLMKKVLGALCIVQEILDDFYKLWVSMT